MQVAEDWLSGSIGGPPERVGGLISPPLRISRAVGSSGVYAGLADAQIHAAWQSCSLLTEQQGDYDARGSSQLPAVPEDKDRNLSGNDHQGTFPARDLGRDGFTRTTSAVCFPANGFGCYVMIGNVWERPKPRDGDDLARAIIKGGSSLYATNYYAHHRPPARQFQTRD